jgi:hypothetical protein
LSFILFALFAISLVRLRGYRVVLAKFSPRAFKKAELVTERKLYGEADEGECD